MRINRLAISKTEHKNMALTLSYLKTNELEKVKLANDLFNQFLIINNSFMIEKKKVIDNDYTKYIFKILIEKKLLLC